MELSSDILPPYVAFLAHAIDEPSRRPTLEKLRADVDAGTRVLSRTRVLVDVDGSIYAALNVEPLDPGTWLLNEIRVLPGATAEQKAEATGLIAETLAQAVPARKIETRVPHNSRFPEYEEALQAAGFEHHGSRVEFKTPLADLPDDTGTPLVWTAATEATFEQAARLMREVSEGDPDWDSADDPSALLRAWLADSYLNGSLDCIRVGHFDGVPVALVVAQVAPTTLWGRITYLGLLPSARSRGLGSWVHRHGFAMLKAQGGKTYQGGTSTSNARMISLFQRHGCKELERYEDWVWRAAPQDTAG